MLLVCLVQVTTEQPQRESRGFGVKSRLTGNPEVIAGQKSGSGEFREAKPPLTRSAPKPYFCLSRK